MRGGNGKYPLNKKHDVITVNGKGYSLILVLQSIYWAYMGHAPSLGHEDIDRQDIVGKP